MNRLTLLAPWALLTGITAAVPAYASRQSATIPQAVITFLHQNGTSVGAANAGALKIDPRVFDGAGERSGFIRPDAPRHSDADLRVLAREGVSEVVSAEQADRCASFAPNDCMTQGKSVVVTLGNPSVAGDSAQVDLFVRVSRYVTPSDSVTILQGMNGRPRFAMERASASVARVFLKRSAEGWTAVRLVVLIQT